VAVYKGSGLVLGARLWQVILIFRGRAFYPGYGVANLSEFMLFDSRLFTDSLNLFWSSV